jgi:hypothetical protein
MCHDDGELRRLIAPTDADWREAEDELLARARMLSREITERVRKLTGTTPLPLPDQPGE